MISCQISHSIKQVIPNFKIGVITYNDIAVDASPQMLKGRLALFQEDVKLTLEEEPLTDFPGIKEWRQTFKALGIDPSRYRPSHEALFRRIKKGSDLPSIHSAADMNNLISLQFQMPLGIYDSDTVDGDVLIAIGSDGDGYEGINGRHMSMSGKLVSSDMVGPFGSPIVDSVRTMVTARTINALQMVYLKPSMDESEAEKLLEAIATMFTHIHGGHAGWRVII